MSQEELEQKIAKLEAEIVSLKEGKYLLSARTALAWAGMVSSAWRHAINNYALTIGDLVGLLRRDLQSKIDFERVNERLTKIEQIADQIRQKPIFPPLSSEEGLETVDVVDLIRKRINQLGESEPYSSIEMNLQPINNPVSARISPEWFRRGLDMLVDNSIEAMTSSNIKRLVIRVLEIDDQIQIIIEDTGYGVPDNVIPFLFKQPISQNRKKKGLGLGLLMAQMIFQTYGGDLQLTNTGSQGTTFTINLPAAS